MLRESFFRVEVPEAVFGERGEAEEVSRSDGRGGRN